MILTNCNCGEKVACGCGTLSFDTYVGSSTSVLNVGNLVSSNGCVLDEYVIDWYRNGVHALVTGKGYDPDIEAFHPMTGNAATPVIGGTYTAVVRYIVVGGVQIFLEPKACKKWCEIIQNLPTITVSSVYCGLVGTGSTAASTGYDYRIYYKKELDYSLAARRVMFDLNETSVYFAFYFYAYSVADRLKIFHKSDLVNPLVDIIVGSDLPSHKWDDDPKEIDVLGVKQFISLPAYSAGDYLILEITPSVKTGNVNTEWYVDLKCLTSSTVFETNIFNDDLRKWITGGFNLTWDSVNCRFVWTVKFRNSIEIDEPANLNLYAGGRLSNGLFSVVNNDTFTDYQNYSVSAGTSNGGVGNGTKMSLNGNATITKTGNIVTIQCDDQSAYDSMKDGVLSLYGSTRSWVTGWENDPTKLTYYRWTQISWITTSTGCGDGEVAKTIYIFFDSVFSWDDANKTVSISLKTISNQLIYNGTACDQVIEKIDDYVGRINGSYNEADFTRTTKCMWQRPISSGNYVYISLPSTTLFMYQLVSLGYKYSCPLALNGTWGIRQTAWEWVNFYFLMYITATRDSTGAWTQDPLENFKVEARWNPKDGTGSPYTIVYQKVNGVVTINLSWEDFWNAMP